MSSSSVRLGIVAAAVVLLVVLAIESIPVPSLPAASAGPVPTSIAASTAIRSPSAAAKVAMDIHRWPGTGLNAPGYYSWQSGVERQGWMHNGYQHVGRSREVEIFFFNPRLDRAPVGPTVASVAGYAGTYQEYVVAGRITHLWIVEIDGLQRTFAIEAESRATPAQLAEAHAIIDSIRYEKQSSTSFRFIFWLPAGWDSG